jgi:hypothetical protein
VSFIGILRSVLDGVSAATTEAPHWQKCRRGRIPDAHGPVKTPTVTLSSRRKSSPLCDHSVAEIARSKRELSNNAGDFHGFGGRQSRGCGVEFCGLPPRLPLWSNIAEASDLHIEFEIDFCGLG